MGTVHSIHEARRPERLRQRFELVTADWMLPKAPILQLFLPMPVFEGYFFSPAEATFRLAEDVVRDYALAWFTFCWDQQQLFSKPLLC